MSSSGSARTFGSTRSGRSSTAARVPPRPSSVARMANTSSGTSSGSGGVTETGFEKAFAEIPDISVSYEIMNIGCDYCVEIVALHVLLRCEVVVGDCGNASLI